MDHSDQPQQTSTGQNDAAAAPSAGRRLVSEFADDPDMAELIQSFVGELAERMYRLEQAMKAENRQALITLSHQLKGAAGGYGFPTITEAARSLEQLARSDDAAVENLSKRLAELHALCEQAAAGTDSTPEVPQS